MMNASTTKNHSKPVTWCPGPQDDPRGDQREQREQTGHPASIAAPLPRPSPKPDEVRWAMGWNDRTDQSTDRRGKEFHE
jgi:hypothetical protein